MRKPFIKVLYFPWPPAPPEVREIQNDIKAIQALVRGSFEGHTLATGDCVYCNDEGRFVFGPGTHTGHLPPHLFPYGALNLSGLESTPIGEDGGTFVAIPAERFEEVMGRARQLGLIDVYGPCLVVGPADDDGDETDIPALSVELLTRMTTAGVGRR